MTIKVNTPMIVNDPKKAYGMITNKDLVTAIKGMLASDSGINKNMWQYAIHANNIIVKELYADDFGTIEKFAQAMDTSKSKLSKYSNACQVMVNHLTPEYGIEMKDLSYSKAYLLSTLNEEIDEFMSQHTKEEICKIAVSQLASLINKFKKRSSGDDGDGDGDGEGGNAKIEDQEITAIIKAGKRIEFELNGVKYSVPFNPDKHTTKEA